MRAEFDARVKCAHVFVGFLKFLVLSASRGSWYVVVSLGGVVRVVLVPFETIDSQSIQKKCIFGTQICIVESRSEWVKQYNGGSDKECAVYREQNLARIIGSKS